MPPLAADVSWPAAFMAVGVMFGWALILWVLTKL
jgi:hypothetical protein